MSLSNKVAIITGSSSGIGAATAILFAQEFADVVIVGRNETKLKNVEQKVSQAGKSPLVIRADVSKDDEARSIIEKTVERYGKIDVLVNNAGFMRSGSILDGNLLKSYDEIMRTNVRAVVYLSSLALPYLTETKGNIVNISSVVALTPPRIPEQLAYYVSKAGLDHFTRNIALELGPLGIRVNSVNPGPVITDFIENSGFTGKISFEQAGAMTALNRTSTADEVADLILFVASDKAKSITGSVHVIDNGYLMKK